MRKTVLIPLLVLAAMLPVGTAGAAPAGPETNPIGTLRWLPDNTNETSAVPSGLSRLVFIFDRSLNAQGKPANLLANGSFGVKILTTSPQITMKGHSDGVSATQDEGAPAQIDEVLAGVHGDIRDGACSKAGTSSFAAAFTTTRTFFHSGTTPYQPQSGSGSCEVVESSTSNGSGFQTRVKTYVAGFWIDVLWPTQADVLSTGDQAHPLAEVWYTAVYDTENESGDFYETSDASGISKSVGSPGDYDVTFASAAVPGAIGAPCAAYPVVPPASPETYSETTVTAPGGATTVTVRLFPKADWDLVVVDPNGVATTSGRGPGFVEEVTRPAIPGVWTIRACNFAGEPTVIGGVIIK
jgi:hypothetical protein